MGERGGWREEVVEKELENSWGQISKGLYQAEEHEPHSIGDKGPSKVFLLWWHRHLPPTPLLPTLALTYFSHRTYYNLEVFMHLSVWC